MTARLTNDQLLREFNQHLSACPSPVGRLIRTSRILLGVPKKELFDALQIQSGDIEFDQQRIPDKLIEKAVSFLEVQAKNKVTIEWRLASEVPVPEHLEVLAAFISKDGNGWPVLSTGIASERGPDQEIFAWADFPTAPVPYDLYEKIKDCITASLRKSQ